MTLQEVQTFADLLNEITEKSPSTNYMWSCAFYSINKDFVEHPYLPVQNIPWNQEEWVMTNLGLLNGYFSQFGFYIVSMWDDVKEKGAPSKFLGYKAVPEVELIVKEEENV